MLSKGIVMQLTETHAVVMTQEAEFRKIPRAEGMRIGQEVDIPAGVAAPSGQAGRSWWNARRFRQSGAVAAALLLAVGVWSYQAFMTKPMAYAYVTVDINPSIEFSVDEERTVIGVTALNADAERVLDDLTLDGKTVQEAVATVTDAAQKQGYLQDQGDVIITATLAGTPEAEQKVDSEADLGELEAKLGDQVKTVAQQGGNEVDVETIVVSPDLRDAAKEAGISPGKYAFYLSAQSAGIDVEIEELKKTSITKIVDARGTELAAIVHSLNGGKQLDKLLDTYKAEGKSGLQKNAKGVLPAGKERAPGQEKKDEDAKKTDKTAPSDASNGKASETDGGKNKGNDKQPKQDGGNSPLKGVLQDIEDGRKAEEKRKQTEDRSRDNGSGQGLGNGQDKTSDKNQDVKHKDDKKQERTNDKKNDSHQ